MVSRHQVVTQHPRYKVPDYMRGSGRQVASPSWQLFQQYPKAPDDYFGYTRDPNQALWITSEGRMISGSIDNKNPWSDYAHSEVVMAYGMGDNGNEAQLWQQMTGAVRMRRSSLAPDATLNIELYQKPSIPQMRTIAKSVKREGTIYVDYWSGDGKALLSQRVKNAGELKRVLDSV